jgi:hypothetical protein
MPKATQDPPTSQHNPEEQETMNTGLHTGEHTLITNFTFLYTGYLGLLFIYLELV